jgi:ElaA protein
MVTNAIDAIRLEFPSTGICLDAQTYLREFYLSLGFEVCGDEFLEDGIPHIPMQCRKDGC